MKINLTKMVELYQNKTRHSWRFSFRHQERDALVSKKGALRSGLLLLMMLASFWGYSQVHLSSQSGTNFTTIQAAIAAANPHDTIKVSAGSFNEQLQIDKPLVLLGNRTGLNPRPSSGTVRNINGIDESIIHGQKSQTLITLLADSILIDGFQISQDLAGSTGGGYAIHSDDNGFYKSIQISNNIINDIGSTAAIRLYGADNMLIERNYFKDLGGDGIWLRNGNKISPVASNQKIVNNDLVNISGTTSGGMNIYGESNLEIAYNFIDAKYQGMSIGTTFDETYYDLHNIEVHHNTIRSQLLDQGGAAKFALLVLGIGDGINIHNNIIEQSGTTPSSQPLVRIGYDYNSSTLSDPELQFNHNSLSRVSGSTGALIYVGENLTHSIDATCNWFGTSNPYDIDTVVRDINYLVDYRTVLNAGTNGVAAGNNGFEPTSSCISSPVHNLNRPRDYNNIEDGVVRALDNDSLLVDAGEYQESIEIDKPITLLGANYTNSGNGNRGNEAIVYPSNDDIEEGFTFWVKSSDVTISGFTLDGDNPNFTSGFLGAGTNADLNGAYGILQYQSPDINNLIIQNNIIRNFSYTGVMLYGTNGNNATTGNVIENNLFKDLGTYDATSNMKGWGIGALIYNSQYTKVFDNKFDNVRIGIQTGNFQRSNPGSADYQIISDNEINSRSLGIFHNLQSGPTSSPASPFTISGNLIQGIDNTNETNWRGVLMGSLGSVATFTDNNIDGSNVTSHPSYGYVVWNVRPSSPAVISGGSVDGVDTGLWVNNLGGYHNQAATDFGGAHASVQNLSINTKANGVGIYVFDNPEWVNASPTPTIPATKVHLDVNENVTVNGGGIGLLVEGPNASVSDSINNLSFKNISNQYIKLVNNDTDIDARGTFYNDVAALSMNPTQILNIRSKIIDNAVDPLLGSVILNNGFVHNITQDTYYPKIHEAVAAAHSHDTIELLDDVTMVITQDPNTTEQVLVDKEIHFEGNGHKISVDLNGSYALSKAPFRINATGAGSSFSNFDFSRVGSGDAEGYFFYVLAGANNLTFDQVEVNGTSGPAANGGSVGNRQWFVNVAPNTDSFIVTNSSFDNLNVIGYINNHVTGRIQNTSYGNTLGWNILADAPFEITGNTPPSNGKAFLNIIDNPGGNHVDPTNNVYTCQVIADIKVSNGGIDDGTKYEFDAFNGSNRVIYSSFPRIEMDTSVYNGGCIVFNLTQHVGYPTIQSAVDDANDHDSVQASNGTYAEAITINKPLTLIGNQVGVDPRPSVGSPRVIDDASETIVAATKAQTILTISSSDVTIDGFEFKQTGNGGGGHAINTTSSFDNVTFSNNIITETGYSNAMRIYGGTNFSINNNYLSNIGGEGIVFRNGNNYTPVATNQKIINNDIVGVHGVTGGAIYTYGETDLEISGNLVEASYQGMQIGADLTAPYYYMENVRVHNNTIKVELPNSGGATKFGINVGGIGHGDGIAIHNNIIAQNSTSGTTSPLVRIGFDNVSVSESNPTLTLNDNYLSLANGSTGNYILVGNNITNNIDATCNWFGTTGIGNIIPLLSDANQVVDVHSYLISGNNNVLAPNPGFEPDVNACHAAPVHNITQNTYYEKIHEAVIAANNQDSIELIDNVSLVIDGTVNEQVIVDKEIHFEGNGYTISTDLSGVYALPAAPFRINATGESSSFRNFDLVRVGAGSTEGYLFYVLSGANNLTFDQLSVKGTSGPAATGGPVGNRQWFINVQPNTDSIIVTNSSFDSLNVIGYINNKVSGRIQNTSYGNTLGWNIISNAPFTIKDNSPSSNGKAFLNIIDNPGTLHVDPVDNFYTCQVIADIKAANGGIDDATKYEFDDSSNLTRVIYPTFPRIEMDKTTFNGGCRVFNISQNNHGYHEIQTAINEANASDTLKALAYTFDDGALTIGKSLTLWGANVDIDPNTGTRGDESVLEMPATATGITVNGSGAINVVINGFKVHSVVDKDAVFLANGLSNVTISNNIFEREGSSTAFTTRAININPSNGDKIVKNNLFTGTSTGVTSSSSYLSWRSGVWYDNVNNNNTGNIGIEDNVFDTVFTGINFDRFGNNPNATIKGNKFGLMNSAIAVFVDTSYHGGMVTLDSNDFSHLNSTVFNLSNVPDNFKVDISAGSYDGQSFASYDLDDLFEIETKMMHKGRAGHVGLVYFVPNTVYARNYSVNDINNPINASIHFATAGDTVYTMAGNYDEVLDVDKTLDLRGAGYNNSILTRTVNGIDESSINPSNNNGQNAVVVIEPGVNNVSINGFSFDGQGISGGIDLVSTPDGNDGLTLSNNFLHNAGEANRIINLGSGSHNVSILRNDMLGGRYGVYLGDQVNDVNTQNNIISGMHSASGNGSGIFAFGKNANINITNNAITNNDFGYVGNNQGNNNGWGNFVMQDNSFANNTQLFDHGIANAAIDASCNWYGMDNFAAINGMMGGVGLSQITFVPYLSDGTNDDPTTPGFTPLPNVCTGPVPEVVANLTDFHAIYGHPSDAQVVVLHYLGAIQPIEVGNVTTTGIFEFSKDGNSWSSTVSFNQPLTDTNLYIRIIGDGTIAVNTYNNQEVSLSNLNAQNGAFDDVLSLNGVVVPDTLSLVAGNLEVTKVYDANVNIVNQPTGHPEFDFTPIGDVQLDETGVLYSDYPNSNAGNYNMGANGYALSGADAGNYVLTDTVTYPGQITTAALVITAADREKCFDDSFQEGQDSDPSHWTVSGLINNDAIVSVKLTLPQGGGSALGQDGEFPIQPSNAVASTGTILTNYNITYVNGTLTSQPLVRAYVSGAANLEICAGEGVSVNYSLYGPGKISAQLQIARLDGNVATPLDTFNFIDKTPGTNLSAVLPPSLTPNTTGDEVITYRLSFVHVESDTTNCAGVLDGQVNINVYPVVQMAVNMTTDSEVCSGEEINFDIQNLNNSLTGSYLVEADYGDATGGIIPATGASFAISNASLVEHLENITDHPTTVTYTFVSSNGTSHACQGDIIVKQVIVNPRPILDTIVGEEVCEGDSVHLTLTGLRPNETFYVDATVTGNYRLNGTTGNLTLPLHGNITSDNNGEFVQVYPSIFGDTVAMDYTITVNSLADGATGCVTNFTNMTGSGIVHPLPTDVLVIDQNNVTNGATVQVCEGQELQLTTSGDAANTYSLYRADHSTLVVPQGNVGDSTYTMNAVMTDDGMYYLEYTSPFGCLTVDSFYLEVNPLPHNAKMVVDGVTYQNGDTAVFCENEQIALTTEGDATNSYRLYRGDNTTLVVPQGQVGDSTYQMTTLLTDEGTYYLHFNSDFGCEIVDTFYFKINPLPTFTFSRDGGTIINDGDTATYCEGEPVSLSLTGLDNTDEWTLTIPNFTSQSGFGDFPDYNFTAGMVDSGIYNLEVKTVNGCTVNFSYELRVHSLPVGNIVVNGSDHYNGDTVTFCENEAVEITTSGASTNSFRLYRDDNTTLVVPQGQMGDSVYQMTTLLTDEGTYYFHYNSQFGCEVVDTFYFKVNPLPTFTLTRDGGTVVNNGDTATYCEGEPVALSLSGLDSSDQWTMTMPYFPAQSGVGNLPAYNFTASLQDSGSYNLHVETVNGCSVDMSYVLVVHPLPVDSLVVDGLKYGDGDTVVFCEGDTIQLTTFGGQSDTYTLTRENGVLVVPSGVIGDDSTYTMVVRLTDSGNYDLNFQTEFGCSVTERIHFTVNPLSTADVVIDGQNVEDGDTLTYCEGGSYYLNIAGSDSTETFTVYHEGNTTPVASGNVGDADVQLPTQLTDSGRYQVYIETLNGCVISHDFVLHINEAPVIQETNHTDVLCYGQETGTFSYSFSGADAGNYTLTIYDVAKDSVRFNLNVPSNTFSANQTNLPAGDYWVYVTSPKGCADSMLVQILQPAAPLSLDVTHDDVVCGDLQSGSIQYNLQGGTPGYHVEVITPSTSLIYDFNNPLNGFMVDDLTAGTHIVNLTDANGCSLSDTVEILAPTSTLVTATVSGPDSVALGSTGGIMTFKADGATGPVTFTYTINGGTEQTVVSDNGSDEAYVAVDASQLGTFGYEITNVSDAHGNICNLNIGDADSVIVYTAGLPDLRVSETLGATVIDLNGDDTTTTLTIYVMNFGDADYNGTIQFALAVPTNNMELVINSNDWTQTLQIGSIIIGSTNGAVHLSSYGGFVVLDYTIKVSKETDTRAYLIQTSANGTNGIIESETNNNSDRKVLNVTK